MKIKILLQLKFLIVQFLNTTINFFPVSLRSFYLKLFGIKVNKHSFIHRNVKFFHVGNFSMGKNSTINFGCYLDNRRGINIGNNVGIAHDTKIYTLGHDIDDPLFKTKGAPVFIEDNVFIFSNCLIMPGVTIHEGAIILAGSVVTKDVLPHSIVGGNPARYIKARSTDIKYSLDYSYWFAL
ncbi:acyltransferase [Aquirufa regiilacus]|uniref:Acyltransferase n=1 Tax=Aquirufa regiilacus TaxID=3024868 RepID=A0ABU3TSQ4_9BACT|nr:acyltransferase [Aquirufa sp. LEOWEIH-7C]MDU0808900.1 acyltransferase [Aquirufa sp. LEOWEIH-7C]